MPVLSAGVSEGKIAAEIITYEFLNVVIQNSQTSAGCVRLWSEHGALLFYKYFKRLWGDWNA